MAKYDWKIEPRDEDWSDDTYAYFLIHINLKRMVEYLTKEFKKDWWFKGDYGQDNCYIVAENNNFPVRLFFTFDEGGWADITRHYTDGASYTDDHLGSWHFAKYDINYSFDTIKDNIKDYFKKFEESIMKEKKSLTERDDLIKNSDVKRWMISGGDVQITFKDGNELVGIIVEYRKDETDSKAECYLCEDITSDYTRDYFIVESYNGKIMSIKFQSYDHLIDYMDKNNYELVESKKEKRKSIKENKSMTLQDAWNNDDKELFLSMINWLETNRKITSKESKDLEEIYDNWGEYKDENPNAKIKFGDLVINIKESLTELFEYEGGIPLDELMDILTEEWQENNTNNLLFRESSHWDDESRDENRYIEISAILDFATPYNSGYSFSNKKIQKQYDKSIEELRNEVEDDDFDDVLYEYEPILLLIAIDLKEEIIYASVDLGNGVVEDVAREKLADNEKDFRKQIQRMINAF